MLALLLAVAHAEPPRDVIIELGGEVRDASVPQPILAVVGPPVTLEVEHADVRVVLDHLARVAGVNVVLADGVKGELTARMVDVPWELALRQVLSAVGAEVVVLGDNLYLVQPLDA